MERFDAKEVRKLLDAFLEDSKTAVVLVEGKKDRKALEELGVPGENIVEVHQGKNLADFVGGLEAFYVIIMTDSDRTGASLKKELKSLLLVEGKKVDTDYRAGFRRLAGVKFVERMAVQVSDILSPEG